MAIAHDATSTTDAGGANPSWSHTCGTGADRFLAVLVPRWAAGAEAVTAVSYNGVALTQGAASTDSGAGDRADVWYLVAPATGANTVAVTCVGVTGRIGAASYTGVHQTVPVGTGVATVGSSTTATVTATSATNEWVVGCMSADGAGAGTPTVPGDQATRWTAAANGQATAASDEPGTTSTVHSYTIGSAAWAIAALPFKPADAGGAAAPEAHRMMLLGVAR